MADARELQYGVDFDTSGAGNSIDGLLALIGALEQQFGAAELGAQNLGANIVSACQSGRAGLDGLTSALRGASDASDEAGGGIRNAGDAARRMGGRLRDAGENADDLRDHIQDAGDSAGDLEDDLEDAGDEAERFRRSIRQTAEGAKSLGGAFRESMAAGLQAGQSIARSFRTGLSGALDFSRNKVKTFAADTLKRIKGIGTAIQHPVKTIRNKLVEALRRAREAEEDAGDAAEDAEDDLEDMGEAGEDAGNRISEAIAGAVAAFAGFEAIKQGIELLKGFAASALGAFASSETTAKKFGAVFSSETAEWVENFSDAVHRSKTEIQSFMVSNKALYSGMGITGDAAVELSKVTTSLAYDLGNAFSMEDAEALGVLQDYMGGNNAALEEFGVHIDEAVLKTAALRMGLGDDIEALDDAAMAQVRMNALLENTAGIQQAAVNSTGGLVNSTKSLKGEFADFMIAAGERIAPAIESLIGAVLDEWSTLEPALLSLADALGNGLNAAVPMLVQLGKDLIPGVSLALEALMNTVSPVLGVLGSLAGTVLPPLSRILAEVASAVLPPVIAVFQSLNENAIQPLMPVVEQVAGQLLPVLGAALSAVGSAAGPLISAFMPLITSVLPVLGSLVSELAGTVLPPLTQVLGTVVRVIQPVLSAVSSLVQGILPAVQPLVSAIGNILSALVVPAIEALSQPLVFVADVLGAIGGVLGDIVGWVSDGVGKAAAFFGGLFGGSEKSKTEVAELGKSFDALGTSAQKVRPPELDIPAPKVPEVPPIQVGVETSPVALPALEERVPAVAIPSVLETPELPALEVEPVKLPVSVEPPVLPLPEVEPVTLPVLVEKPVIPVPEVEPVLLPVTVEKPVIPEPDPPSVQIQAIHIPVQVEEPIITYPETETLVIPVVVEKPVIPSPGLPKLPALVLGAANTAPFSDSIAKTTAGASRQAVKSGDDIRTAYENAFDRIGAYAGNVYSNIASSARSAWSGMASAAESGAGRIAAAFERVGAAARELASVANVKVGVDIPHNAAGTDHFPGGLTYMNEEGGELAILPSGTAIIPADKTDDIIRTAGSSNNVVYTDNSTLEPQFHITVNSGGADIAGEITEKVREMFQQWYEEKKEAEAHQRTIQYAYTIH